jgi:hypothetical protein
MFPRVWRRASVLVLTVGSLLTTQSATAETSVYTKPKVRAITAFVRVLPASLEQ